MQLTQCIVRSPIIDSLHLAHNLFLFWATPPDGPPLPSPQYKIMCEGQLT